MVAHPDDCVIYAIGYILAHSEYTWNICYLTHRCNTIRGVEISNFWQRRGITTDFLGFSDNRMDWKTDKLSFDPVLAQNFISKKIQSAELVLTHNEHGEYGHIHHRFVHACCKHHSNMVNFAHEGIEYAVPCDYYSLDELPIHAKSISLFVNPKDQINYFNRT